VATARDQDELLGDAPCETPNALVSDLAFWAHQIFEKAQNAIGYLYPSGKDGLPIYNYFWARTVPCANPSCRAKIPLIRSLLLRPEKPRVGLQMFVDLKTKVITFGIARGASLGTTVGTKQQRGPAICPCCKQATSEDEIRHAAMAGLMGQTLIGVVVERGGSRDYRAVEESDRAAFEAASKLHAPAPTEFIVPEVTGPGASPRSGSHRSINLELYGLTHWGQLFNKRQLAAMDALVSSFQATAQEMATQILDGSYRTALLVYLALWISRFAGRCNSVSRWFPGREAIQSPFSGQSIPMMWDYPEVNPFSNSPAGLKEQLARMLEVITREQFTGDKFHRPHFLLGSATRLSIESETCDCVVTDPPYGDAIAYADLSDFFYVWLKQMLAGIFPQIFSTPQTPKEEEATSHKHRHEGSRERAGDHYQRILTRSFREALRVTKNPKLISVMFAHQSTQAWAALLSALFDSGYCPNATWPIATEMPNAALGLETASLESSVTVVCRPRAAVGSESFKVVKREIEKAVEQAVHRFWSYGFRGADLIVASYGPAVGVFGNYNRVERANGTPVEVPELLALARQAARDSIAGEFRGDNLSTLYYVWASLYGIAEQSWDDARLIVQIGGAAENAMEIARQQEIFVVDGSTCRLALLADRANRRGLGADAGAPLVDALHRAMSLWKAENRAELTSYLAERYLFDDPRFWKLAQALFEVLPRDTEDWKLVAALLGERDTLRAEARNVGSKAAERTLFDMRE
jgi:adenine-specific DNA methylase